MSSPTREGVPTLLRPPSYHPAPMDWPPGGGKPQYVVINPMHIINLQDRTRTFAVRVVEKIKAFSEKWFTHVLLIIFLLIYAILGALLFQWLEAPLEEQEKKSVIQVRNLVIEFLFDKQSSDFSNWSYIANKRLKEYEEQLDQFKCSKVPPDSEDIKWNFWGSLFYAGTIFTTIGYGNIYPVTVSGQVATILYAFIGIPFLLMVLADLGKLFTRWIKAVFFYVKLFCQTGKFRKARKMGRRATAVPVQYMSVAWNKMPYMIYQGRSKKRQSDDIPPYEERDLEREGSKSVELEDMSEERAEKKDNKKSKKDKKDKEQKHEDESKDAEEAEDYIMQQEPEEDDEFNLPVSLAVLLLIAYMMLGALLFSSWEHWSFFESFYFVFISMSTIGFGDYVPAHPAYMMATFIYLLFGLALTSMCINVVQEKLSATFQMAKMRIGTTIGLDANILMEDDVMSGSETPNSRRRGSSVKSRRGSKSVQSSPPRTDEDEDIKIDTVATQNKQNGVTVEPLK